MTMFKVTPFVDDLLTYIREACMLKVFPKRKDYVMAVYSFNLVNSRYNMLHLGTHHFFESSGVATDFRVEGSNSYGLYRIESGGTQHKAI